MSSFKIRLTAQSNTGYFRFLPEELQNLLPKYLNVEDIARWSGTCRTFRSCIHSPLPLSLIFVHTYNIKGAVDILSSFGCAKIVEEYCLALMFIVGDYGSRNVSQHRFYEMGGYEQIFKKLYVYGDIHEKIAEYCCIILDKMGFYGESSALFCCMGGFSTIFRILNAFGSINLTIAKSCLSIIADAISDDRTRRHAEGDVNIIIRILNSFGRIDADVARAGCRAVAILALNKDVSKELGRVGGCETILDILESFGKKDKGIATRGCWAACVLVKDMDNRKILLASRVIIESCVENCFRNSLLRIFLTK